MTNDQIEAKILELEIWLIKNLHSPERNLIELDLKTLRTKLIDRTHE